MDPYFGRDIALPATDTIHKKLIFNSTYSTGKLSYSVHGEVVSLYLYTNETGAHYNGMDGTYYFDISSPDTSLTCEFIDTDDMTVGGTNHGDRIGFAILLPNNKIYKIRIKPDNMKSSVVINAEVSYSPFRNLGTKI